MKDSDARRCAIYTRKSSDEGLEQAFNSLHSQREACEDYIRSQAGEGWRLHPDRYDDGGYSGAGMDRPALRRLLADVSARRVDMIVVYKVDRLTRSLSDFARIIDALDETGSSFVSVTQAFNTTSSMGRLTLNMLLSFAQFEREITGERIRDKIAASKAKGLWMGGLPPLGYDPSPDRSARTLVVNQTEATAVRTIFWRFLEAGNTFALQKALAAEGLRSKRWVTEQGHQLGGVAFSRGALAHLLQNRVYLGEITHRGVGYAGKHPPIVDRQTFDAAQALLKHGQRKRRMRETKASSALLSELLFDECGHPMKLATAGRSKRRSYRYYVALSNPFAVSGLR